MASSKVMKSSNSRNSDLSKRSSSIRPPTQQQTLTPAMTVDGILRDVYNTTAVSSTTDATLLDAQITLIDTNENNNNSNNNNNNNNNQNEEQNGVVTMSLGRTVDDVWREIVSGEKKEMKEEALDEMMTLEDFLVKAGAVDDVEEEGGADVDVKLPITERLSGGLYAFDPAPPASPFQVEGAIVGFGNGVEVIGGGIGGVRGGRGKRGRVMLEPLDRAAQQRQRRMIKNRESAARSRERKQAYQVELESLAVRLEEENEQLLKEKAERTKERYKQLMENVVPVVEKQKKPRILRRVRSMQW